MSDVLRSHIIRLAYTREDLRPHLLSVIKSARGFPSPQSLQDYLGDHPNAEKDKHWVEKSKQDGPSKPKSTGKPNQRERNKGKKKPRIWSPPASTKPNPKVEEAKKALAKAPSHIVTEAIVQIVSPKVAEKVSAAPPDVQKFVYDHGHRNKVIKETAAAFEKGVESLHVAVKSTLKDVKTTVTHAGPGLKKMLSNQDLSEDEEVAIKKVVSHVADAVTAALSDAKPMRGIAKSLGNTFLKSITDKLVASASKEINTLLEAGSLASRLWSTFAGKKAGQDEDPTEAFALLVSDMMTKALKDGMSDDDLLDALGNAA